MEATIDQVLNRSGRQISLQVRDTNPAVALYQRMGFRPLGSVTRWISTGRPRLGALHTSGSPVRPAQSKDWLALWQLFRSVTVAAQGWPDPLTMPHFRPRWWRSLLQLLNDETMRRWVAPAPFDGILDGYVELHGIAGRYRLTLRVRTGAVGQVEGDLLQEALSAVDRAGDGTVVIDHPSEEKTAEERFREAGFRADRTLILMQLQLKPQGGDSDGNI
jgi:hypothetical protein